MQLPLALGSNLQQLSLLLLIIVVLLLFLSVDRFHLLLDLQLDLLVVNFTTISQKLQVEPVHLGGCRILVEDAHK